MEPAALVVEKIAAGTVVEVVRAEPWESVVVRGTAMLAVAEERAEVVSTNVEPEEVEEMVMGTMTPGLDEEGGGAAEDEGGGGAGAEEVPREEEDCSEREVEEAETVDDALGDEEELGDVPALEEGFEEEGGADAPLVEEG